MDNESTKIFFVNCLDFMEGRVDRNTFNQYCAFLINELIDIGFEHSEIIGWLLDWGKSKRKELV